MQAQALPRPSSVPPHIKVALTASLIIHLLFLLALSTAPTTEINEPLTFDVSIELPAKLKSPESQVRRQIVTPPDKSLDLPEPPENTPLLSDEDSATDKEQIKRGDAPDAGPNPQPRQREQQASREVTIRKEAPAKKEAPTERKEKTPKALEERPRLKQLTLDDDTLREKFAKKNDPPSDSPARSSSNAQAVDLRSYQAFSRPAGSGAAVLGLQGSSDYLPSLPDGDVTLLNAKAEKFAVFVRRVAIQVFSNIRQSGWDVLGSSDVRAIGDFSTIIAILSPQGKLLKVTLQGQSGSNRFDAIIEDAVKHGAKDSNPPAQAVADDGNIHFIFKARSWSEMAVAGRTGAAYERRWLLLATGLE